MQRILVVEDTPIFRELFSALLQAQQYRTSCAADGCDALISMDLCPPDLVLLDLVMPRMDGLTLLKEIRRHPRWQNIPVIVVTGDSRRENVVEATRLGVQGYLLKDAFSITEFLATIATAVASDKRFPPAIEVALTRESGEVRAPVPKQIQRAILLEAAKKGVPALSHLEVVAEVIAASSTDGDLGRLALVFNSDPALATRVLQLANTVAYAPAGTPVLDIRDAISRLGLQKVADLTTKVGVFDSLPQFGVEIARSWQHSLTVAALMDRLLEKFMPGARGVGRFVGLCHALGEMILRREFSAEYNRIVDLSAERRRPLDELEREQFGMTAAELACEALRTLNLPAGLTKPLEEIAQLDPRRPFKHISRLGLALLMADYYANALLAATSQEAKVMPFPAEIVQALSCDLSDFSADAEKLRMEVDGTMRGVSTISHQDWKELSVPFFMRSPSRVAYIRDSTLSRFDPIERALTCMADVEVCDISLTPENCGGYDCVFIVAQNPSLPEWQSLFQRLSGEACPRLLCLAGKLPVDRGESPWVKFRRYPLSLRNLHESLSAPRTEDADERISPKV